MWHSSLFLLIRTPNRSLSSADEVTEEQKLSPCGITRELCRFQFVRTKTKIIKVRSGNVQKLLKLINKLPYRAQCDYRNLKSTPSIILCIGDIASNIKEEIIAQFKGGICFVNFQLSRWHNLMEVRAQYVGLKTFPCLFIFWDSLSAKCWFLKW